MLNIIRTDFSQDWLNGTEGMVPELLVGDQLNCYQQSIEKVELTKYNRWPFKTYLPIRCVRRMGCTRLKKILEMDFDSNVERQMVIKAFIKPWNIQE